MHNSQHKTLRIETVWLSAHVNHDLQDKFTVVILYFAGSRKSLGNVLHALDAMCDEGAQIRHAFGGIGQHLNGARVGVCVAENADQVDFTERSCGHGEREDWRAHADNHDLAARLGALVVC